MSEPARTALDFTDPHGSFYGRVNKSAGWEWIAARKLRGGKRYVVVKLDEATDRGNRTSDTKISYTACSPYETLSADVIFAQGTLVASNLRSYEGQADVKVELLDASTGAAACTWILNGTWNRGVSTYDAARLSVPREMWERLRLGEAPRPRADGIPAPWMARLRITSLPKPLSAKAGRWPVARGVVGNRTVLCGESSVWAPFSLYAVTTY